MILLYYLKSVYIWDEFIDILIFLNKGVINIFICRIFIYVMYINVLKLDNEIDKM